MFDIRQPFYPNDNAYLQYKCDAVPEAKHFFRHIHSNCEIHLFVGGNASFNLEGDLFSLKPYDLIVIPPQSYHCLILNSLQPYERFIFNFPKAVVPFEDDNTTDVTRVFNIKENRPLLSVFERMEEYSRILSPEDFPMMAKTLLQELLLLLRKECSTAASETAMHRSLASGVVRYINEHLYGELSIDEIANEFHLSKSHIQNVFCRDMQMGLKSFILHKKMSCAKDMLRGGMPPMSVAAQLGFPEYTTFYRGFVKVNAHPPKYYTKP